MRFWFVLSAALLMSCRVGAVSLGDGALRIFFGEADEGFALQSVVNRMSGETRFVYGDGAGQADFWELRFRGVGASGTNETVRLCNRSSGGTRTCDRKDDRMTFRWQGLDLPGEPGVVDVAAAVRMLPDGATSEWAIKVANRSSKYALAETVYPYLREVIEAGKGDYLRPGKPLGAQLLRNFHGEAGWEYFSRFPSCSPPITAYLKDGVGLYIGVHDPEVRIKRFVAGPWRDFRVETPVENAGVVGKAAGGPGFKVTIAAFKGDWWQVAKIYRAWALKQKWCAKGPIAKRADYPKAMVETDVWEMIIDKDPMSVSNSIVNLKRAFPDLKVGVHWYVWHNSDFDVNFPEFFPPRKGVPAVMEFGARNGVTMMPYTDPRLWDVGQASWAFAKEGACCAADGTIPTEKWQGRELAVMCPSDVRWRQSVWDWSRQVIEIAKATAVYYDQIACSRAPECHNPKHGHPLGGGKWWTDGYREMLEPMHRMFSGRNLPITSELTGDTWLDLIDGYLCAGYPNEYQVPFYPAVYAGYATYFGCEEDLKDPEETFNAWQSMYFAWGVVPGDFDRWRLGSSEFRRQQALIGRFARVRRAARDFLAYGTLEGEPEVVRGIAERELPWAYKWTPEKVKKMTFKDAYGSVWKTIDGKSTAVVFANCLKEPKTIEFRVPVAGLEPVVLPETAGVTYSESDGIGRLVLPPLGIAYLRRTAQAVK